MNNKLMVFFEMMPDGIRRIGYDDTIYVRNFSDVLWIAAKHAAIESVMSNGYMPSITVNNLEHKAIIHDPRGEIEVRILVD